MNIAFIYTVVDVDGDELGWHRMSVPPIVPTVGSILTITNEVKRIFGQEYVVLKVSFASGFEYNNNTQSVTVTVRKPGMVVRDEEGNLVMQY